jgi:hypothetical protein
MKNSSTRRTGAAVLALAIALTISPAMLAQLPREREPRDVRERIIRIIKKVFGGFTSNDDLVPVTPPKP